MTTDPASLTADLIRCPSVTPNEGGALTLLDGLLSAAGFRTVRTDRGGIPNLFACWGEDGPALGFNGHTDVVPPGDRGMWRYDPFDPVIDRGVMFGRGAADMKSGVAAFVAAAIDFVTDTPPDGRIVLTVTGDEEDEGKHGTRAILDWMEENGERMDHCIVGEPTCPSVMGEMIKIGRRGSVTVHFTAYGTQGHSAYPARSKNPIPALIHLLDRLNGHELDSGTTHFDPSTLAITTIDTGNRASNVIPAQANATVNIRFNDTHSSASLSEWVEQEADAVAAEFGIGISAKIVVTGESFLTEPDGFITMVAAAVETETGTMPEFSTSGGTSDARFIKDHCPVVEVGLVGTTMHQADERVSVEHIHQLKSVYSRILTDYFTATADPQERP